MQVSFTLQRSSDGGDTWADYTGFPDGSGGTTATITTDNDGEFTWEIPTDLDPSYLWQIISFTVEAGEDPVVVSTVPFEVSTKYESQPLNTVAFSTDDVVILNFGSEVRFVNGKEDFPSIYISVDRVFIWGEAVSYTHLTLPTICSV